MTVYFMVMLTCSSDGGIVICEYGVNDKVIRIRYIEVDRAGKIVGNIKQNEVVATDHVLEIDDSCLSDRQLHLVRHHHLVKHFSITIRFLNSDN